MGDEQDLAGPGRGMSLQRRRFLAGGVAVVSASLWELETLADQLTPEEIRRLTPEERQRRADEIRQKAIAAFPFERVETTGDRALVTWEELKRAGRGSPVVVGGDDSVARLMDPFSPILGKGPTVEEILTKAASIHHPQDLLRLRSDEKASSRESVRHLLDDPNGQLPSMFVLDADGQRRELSRDEVRAQLSEDPEPVVGEWPAEVDDAPTLSVVTQSGAVLPKVHVAIIPTDDWTTIPAFLRWGGWNECPAPEFHVAALRSWRDRFGAELIGLSPDVMNLRLARSPENRVQALELAREQYAYCNDIVDQGVETLSRLAATLMASRWWYFWWD